MKKLVIGFLIVLGISSISYAEEKNALLISGGIQLKLESGEYTDLLANVDMQYLKNFESNFTYGIGGGLYRMKGYYLKDSNGVDVGPKVEGYDSLYVCGRVGTSIRPAEFMYMTFLTGPCWFDRAHMPINGHIQFKTEAGYGLRDPKTGSFVGINYSHYSNAGLKENNYGANFYSLVMGISL